MLKVFKLKSTSLKTLKQKMFFRSWICVICSGFPALEDLRLCFYCLEKSQRWFLPEGDREVSPFARGQFRTQFDFAEMEYGFLWAPHQARAKVHLLHSLKGKGGHRLWPLLADRFIQNRPHLTLGHPHLFLPLPGRQDRIPDHAWLWAQALRGLLGGHVLRVFQRTNDVPEQKKRSKSERRQIDLRLRRADLGPWLEYKRKQGWKLVLVDDIVTTGATAQAAWVALGKLSDLSIWALAHRITLRNSI